MNPSLSELAIKYRVEHIAGALIPGSRLSNILNEMEMNKPISNFAKEYLRKMGLLALLGYSEKALTFIDFIKATETEYSERCLNVRKEQAEQKLEEEAMQTRLRLIQERTIAERVAFENDPKNRAKIKQFELRQKYDLSCFIPREDFLRLMDILRNVDNSVRLSEGEIKWLLNNGNENYPTYFTIELKERYHENEADYYALEFKNGKNPWSAVNASKHYRKCNKAKTADSILNTIDLSSIKDFTLKSALCTTRGGVMRDLERWDEALCLGKQAHLLNLKSFHPCTLLGAVNIQTGNYALGHSWYNKAVELGYDKDSMDYELRGIFSKFNASQQEKFRDHLLSIDSERYSWSKKRL